MSFTFNDLSEHLVQAVTNLGYTKPTEIQEKTIPLLAEGNHDFVGQAQTGTGKTGAFLLPLLENFDHDNNNISALILTPTRELAQQVYLELEKFSSTKPVNSLCVYGGTSYRDQITKLRKGKVQIVVGTPGRIIDLIDRGELKLGSCQKLIIDEADEMLNMGFLPDVEKIIEHFNAERKIWMFSATMPKQIVSLINDKFNNPKIIRSGEVNKANQNIKQSYIVLNRKDFIRGLKLFFGSQKECFAIIFCETRWETEKVSDNLNQSGLSSVCLQGDLSQAQRDRAIRMFKEKKVDILVCTDVASRGLDIDHVTHVINLGLPRHLESYVHRIGRTGRADKTGQAVTLITPNERRDISKIEKRYQVKLEAIKLPNENVLKTVKLEAELEKMIKIKESLLKKGEDFDVDKTFPHFSEFLKDLSKDEVMKLLFTFYFNPEFRRIDENLKIAPVFESGSMRGKGRSNASGSRGRLRRSSGDRDDSRRGEGRRRDRDGRRGDDRRGDGPRGEGRRGDRDGRFGDRDARRGGRDGRRGESRRGDGRRSESSRSEGSDSRRSGGGNHFRPKSSERSHSSHASH
ncbi:DEAD/DEAH box helicase [Bacteriovoracaceae bacterium]|nr:DEAD/DEAH box helicase [Bacteriovoracaceae bacterium]